MKKSGKSAEEIALAYKSPPWWYDVRGFFILKLSYRSSLFRQIAFFARNVGTHHLEVAVGSGTLLGLILLFRKLQRKPQSTILGVDYAEAMLAGAIRNFRGQKNITFKLADAAAMDLPDNEFDTVNIINAIHCIPDVDGALREVFRVLKPGRALAFNALLYPCSGGDFAKKIAKNINDWGMKKGILYSAFKREDMLARCVAAGFKVEFEEIEGNCLTVIVRKPENI